MNKKPNKDYDGTICTNCEDLIELGKASQEEIDDSHLECHGWFHRGRGCCGECSHCNQ